MPLAAIESNSPKSLSKDVAFLDKVMPAPNSLIEPDLSYKSTSRPCSLRAYPEVKPEIPAPIIPTRFNTIKPWF